MLVDVVDGMVVARFNNVKVANGTYKFNVIAKVGENYSTTAPLTVKVVDKAAADTLKKLTVSGSIDVLNRSNTSSSVTPTFQYLNGTITDVSLSGRNGNLFAAELVNGKVVITANEDAKLITKYAYKMNLVLTVENAMGDSMEITSKEISVTVKQGKATVSAVPKSAIIYAAIRNEIVFDVDAKLSGAKNPVIEKVELVNFADVFEYDFATSTLSMKDNGVAVKGKSYALQFKVTLEGQAANEKAVVLKYNVSVK